MKKIFLCISLLSLSILTLTGCKKEEVLDKPVGFGENKEIIETTVQESTVLDDFAFDSSTIQTQPIKKTEAVIGSEVSDDVIKQQQENIEESLEVYLEELKEEKQEFLGDDYEIREFSFEDEYLIDSSGKEVWIEDIGDGLVASMREQIFDGLITEQGMSELDSFIDDNFSNESDEVKQTIKDYINYCWDEYTYMEESIAALPPEETWSDEELAENPDLRWYSRSEMEYIDKKLEEFNNRTNKE